MAGRHAGAAARRPDLHPDGAAGRARAACVDRRGRSTLDLYGKGFVLLRFGDDAPSGNGIVRAFAAAGVPLRLEMLTSPEVRKLYERALVLVRPDGHVAWRADQEPADASALADCVRGAGRLSQVQAVERAS